MLNIETKELKIIRGVDFMNTKIREATINDLDKGLLSVFIEGYRYHQNGRPDVFANISDDVLKEDLINNLNRLSTIVIFDGDTDNIIGEFAPKKDEKIIRIVPISPTEIKTKSIINKEDIETKYGIVTYNPNKPNKKGND